LDQLSAMQTFRRVVDLGSFSAAAHQAGVSHTVLSRQVKHLERHLGTQLLNRTTRRLQVTEAGALFYRHCTRILEQMQAMNLELSEHQQQPSGTLRLGVATAFGELELGHWLPDFVGRHERLQVELHCSDRFIDLLEEDIDVCLRVTDHLPDSSLVARRLADSEVVLVAAPCYLERHGTPTTPEALAAHPLLGYSRLPHPQRLQLTGPAGERREYAPAAERQFANGPARGSDRRVGDRQLRPLHRPRCLARRAPGAGAGGLVAALANLVRGLPAEPLCGPQGTGTARLRAGVLRRAAMAALICA